MKIFLRTLENSVKKATQRRNLKFDLGPLTLISKYFIENVYMIANAKEINDNNNNNNN